jgi:RNA polymerase sigma-70 factor (ECF subfamily)
MRLSSLSLHQRRAVVLRHVIGLGTGEIAEATGRPEGTVKADIHRGLERLRRVMEQET